MKRRVSSTASGILRSLGLRGPRTRAPNVREIYARAALDDTRNPVIVIHGILGARLVQRSTGKTVWGAFTAEGIDPSSPEGIRACALPLECSSQQDGKSAERGDVYAAGPLGVLKLNVLYRVHQVEVYATIIRVLGAGGYIDQVEADPSSPRYATDHYSCFTFFYDWRLDNLTNAMKLHRFIQEKRREISRDGPAKIERLRAEGGKENLAKARSIERWLENGSRFDVVAHSMGGLMARYYLRYGANDLPADGSLPAITWRGAEEIDRLVLVGTPSLGSMDALRNLLEGYKPSRFLPGFHAVVLGTMPSIYQLLPRVRHNLMVANDEVVALDFMDPHVWDRNAWGMLSPDADEHLELLLPQLDSAAERRERAREHVGWCLERAKRFHASLDAVPTESCPAELILFTADAEPTLSRARVTESGGRLRLLFEGEELYLPGDGTVARYSAVADEREGGVYEPRLRSPVPWTSVMFLSDDHLGLTRNPHFIDNLLFRLLEQRPLAGALRGAQPRDRAAGGG